MSSFPCVDDSILVLFDVDDEKVWFPAMVETFVSREGEQSVLGDGTICYERFMGFPSQMHHVEFRNGQFLRHLDGEYFGMSSKWKLQDEDEGDDRSFPGNQRTLSQPPITRGQSRQNAWDSSKRTQLASRGVKRTEPDGGFAHVGAEDPTSQQMVEEQQFPPPMLDDILKRLCILEGFFYKQHECNHMPAYRERTHAFLQTVKTHLIRDCLRRHIRFSGIPDTDYAPALRRYMVRTELPCDFDLFSLLSRTILGRHEKDIIFCPSFSASQLYGGDVTIIFKTAFALFKWFGIDHPDDHAKLMYKTWRANNKDMARMLGGFQTVVVDTDVRQCNLFYAASCTSTRKHLANAGEGGVSCLHMPSTEWDKENQSFTAQWTTVRATTGLEDVDAVEIGNAHSGCFSVRWCARADMATRQVSAQALSTGSVRVGVLLVEVPCVMFIGSQVHSTSSLISSLRDKK